jgi:hypothetical protein
MGTGAWRVTTVDAGRVGVGLTTCGVCATSGRAGSGTSEATFVAALVGAPGVYDDRKSWALATLATVLTRAKAITARFIAWSRRYVPPNNEVTS